jgi:hypothetical protein
MRDTCENRLVEFFRPNLIASLTDSNMGHEPYFAVRWSPSSTTKADIFWAFAYYTDGGTPVRDAACDLAQGYCNGHYGDSEWLLIRVRYNGITRHWDLELVQMSQHGGAPIYTANQLRYSGRPYAYPDIFVAWGKHANYPSDSACDSGGVLNKDECDSNRIIRSAYSAYHNLGSSHHPLRNCVYSESTYFGNGVSECFWSTGGQFSGWTGISNPPPWDTAVPNYGAYLMGQGF